jgi:phosphotriesterase-related protein
MMTSRREFLTRTGAAGIAAAISIPITHSEAPAQTGLASKPRRVGVVQTVLGPLEASKLGFTLTHEHIADAPWYLKKWPESLGGKAGFVAKAVDKLKAVRAAGVSTIVDLTTYDVGRDIRFLEEVSRKSGMQIVAATGQRLFPPDPVVDRTAEEFTKFFIKEIEVGIDDTPIKAGVIKVATGAGELSAFEEKVLRAGARASKATGVPIETHTVSVHRGGERQAAIFEDEGVNPARVSMGHSDDTSDMDYFLGLVRRGYTLGMDHVNRGISPDFKPSLKVRAECIKQLIDAGFAGKIFLSHDSEFCSSLLAAEDREWREKLNPDGMLFNTRKLIPYLEQIGVSDRDIDIITVDNPKHFLSRS